MNKIFMIIVTVTIAVGTLSGCGKAPEVMPDASQLRTICELATHEYYYHNVAKADKSADKWYQKDRKMWIEYTGVAKVGIDMEKLSMKVNKNKITVSIPTAKVLNCEIYNITEDSIIVSDDGIFKNKITAAEQASAVDDAQNKMVEDIENNSELLELSQNRAKALIENYINQLGEISGVKYKITWKYID